MQLRDPTMLQRVLSGDVHAVARLISLVERDPGCPESLLPDIYAAGGNARIIGVTGPPGSGKSTLVRALTVEFRSREKSVGIIAVDPSSPFSGGAILGDRIRMSAVVGDRGVFVRSMATRGTLGGLARGVFDATAILDAAGKDIVIIETVGVGQDEVEIAEASHTTVVVSAPGMGDHVQAMKAGVLEIADIHVVNKADLPGAQRVVRDLRSWLSIAGQADSDWRPPILLTSAEQSDGVATLAESLDGHRRWQSSSGELRMRSRRMAAARIRAIFQALLHERLQAPADKHRFEQAVDDVCARVVDPYTAGRRLLEERG